jgi:hypothetical protein
VGPPASVFFSLDAFSVVRSPFFIEVSTFIVIPGCPQVGPPSGVFFSIGTFSVIHFPFSVDDSSLMITLLSKEFYHVKLRLSFPILLLSFIEVQWPTVGCHRMGIFRPTCIGTTAQYSLGAQISLLSTKEVILSLIGISRPNPPQTENNPSALPPRL